MNKAQERKTQESNVGKIESTSCGVVFLPRGSLTRPDRFSKELVHNCLVRRPGGLLQCHVGDALADFGQGKSLALVEIKRVKETFDEFKETRIYLGVLALGCIQHTTDLIFDTRRERLEVHGLSILQLSIGIPPCLKKLYKVKNGMGNNTGYQVVSGKI
jgi:hypothetical protein